MRAGHTEAGCDLARLAGKKPAAAICEIMNDDGTMARVPQLIEFAKRHHVKLGTIADLIRYRSRHEQLVQVEAMRSLTTPYGTFDMRVYRDHFGGAHLALSVPTLVECDHCHEMKRPHHVCPNCGWHNGRQAIELKQTTTDTAS